ncbi:MAG TPA: aminoglycoside phosphotransferase family protein [Candidatus Saccharimonadales bacterium]|nr:aminoglycoside phosphotransferase family protein [Candidatus Saccharimonadales bacterium]
MSEAYDAAIHAIRPDAQSLVGLGGGDFNEVVLVDDQEVFRFPKDEEGRGALRYDAALLDRLDGKVSLQIPRPIELAEDASYGVFSFVPGRVLPAEAIQAFSAEEMRALGQALATFMLQISAILTVSEMLELRSRYDPNYENDAQYYERILREATTANSPLLTTYKQYYDALLARFGGRLPQNEIVTHGDLHYGNFVFSDTNELTGVIDFSDCGPSSIYGDLRQIYRLGEPLVQSVVDGLDGALGPINMDVVRTFAVVHELSVLLRSKEPNERADLAESLLRQWLGDDWREQT